MDAGSLCCNILWVVLGGWVDAFLWCLFGVIYCITIVGIPFGTQAIKMGCFMLWPFGRHVADGESNACTCICNVIWFIFGGLEIFIVEVIIAISCCITIIGIPFGVQHFKFAYLALCPFGKVISTGDEKEMKLILQQPPPQPVTVNVNLMAPISPGSPVGGLPPTQIPHPVAPIGPITPKIE